MAVLSNHQLTLARPKFDTARRWFQARCSCGWTGSYAYTRRMPVQQAANHQTREYDAALYQALGEAADRNETLSIRGWKDANPLPTSVFAEEEQ